MALVIPAVDRACAAHQVSHANNFSYIISINQKPL